MHICIYTYTYMSIMDLEELKHKRVLDCCMMSVPKGSVYPYTICILRPQSILKGLVAIEVLLKPKYVLQRYIHRNLRGV